LFIQVISGTVIDEEGLRRQADRWEEELRPGAVGFLGSTGGLTEAGRCIHVARFVSEDAARRNSMRDEQGAWWAETEKCVENVLFLDSVQVTTMRGGGSNDAAFVQVIRGRVIDPAKLAELERRMGEVEAMLARHRPEVLGEVVAAHADGSYTEVVYFSSEADARRGEAVELPAEAVSLFGEWMSATTIDEYLDLTDPWLR
jgi:hypothetical protein